MEIFYKQFRPVTQVWFALSFIALAITFYLSFRYTNVHNQYLTQAKTDAQKETLEAARQLDSFINMLKPIVNNIAQTISEKSLSAKQIEALLANNKRIEISGLGVAFEPFAFDDNKRLYAPYFFEMDGNLYKKHIEDSYDYSQPEYEWYHAALQSGPGFTEPYYGNVSKTILAEYSAPIYRTNPDGSQTKIGIVFANQSIEHLQHILDTLFLDQNGYWTILTKKGYFLSHPQSQIVHRRVTIFDLAKEMNNPQLAQIGKQITEQKPVFFEYNNEITGAPSWLFSEPISGTNWSIVGIFDKSELDIHPQVLRRNLIYPSLSLALFAILFTFAIFSLIVTDHPGRWWFAITLISLALAGQIVWVWYVSYLYPTYSQESLEQVRNKSELHNYLKQEAATYRYGRKIGGIKSHEQEAVKKEHLISHKQDELIYGDQNNRYVPTGIFINNLQFISANIIQMSGYVWQRFTKGLHDNVPRGFSLPQATEVDMIEISRIKAGETDVILYSVFAKLNQFFKFDRYPFDTKTIQVQLWHQYTAENIVLTPDLDAYQLINPRSLPGIDDDVHLPGWNLISSNFGYKKINYPSNFGAYTVGPFGIYKSVDKSEVPELFFELLVTRRLLDTLVSDLLPVAVIAVLIFVTLLTSVWQEYAVIGSLATVFFSAIFSHLRFRGNIPQSEVVYFESFYFLMYVMILFVLTVSLSYTMGFNIRLIRYKENFIAKLSYWPLLFGALSAITLWYLF